MVKGALHIHSRYSDGEFTLAELRDRYIAAGCRFAGITDHADWFDDSRLAEYRLECAARSDDCFRFIPGLEYSCVDRMHVIGYGVTEPIDSTDPQMVIRHIRAHGGLAVVAHPKNAAFEAIEAFDPLPDGIEAWNSKYDGRYAPRPETFALLARIRTRRTGAHAFYGQDLHWKRQYRGLFTLVETATIQADDVLAALRAGRYVGMKAGRFGVNVVLPADGVLEPALAAQFARIHRRSDSMRVWTRHVKTWADGLGLRVPPPLKAQLRRMF
jgi:hypothetical protein